MNDNQPTDMPNYGAMVFGLAKDLMKIQAAAMRMEPRQAHDPEINKYVCPKTQQPTEK